MPLTLGAVILLAACTGGGSDSSDAGSTPTPQGTQTPTEAGTPEATQEPTPAGTPEATQAPPEETAEPTLVAGEPSGDATGPCSLLSKAEIQAAVGNPVKEGVIELFATGFEGRCFWLHDPEGISASLDLRVSTLESCTAERAPGLHPDDVSGLGVEAWWVHQGFTDRGHVTACPEGWRVFVNLQGAIFETGADEAALREATLRAAAEELIAKVLERL